MSALSPAAAGGASTRTQSSIELGTEAGGNSSAWMSMSRSAFAKPDVGGESRARAVPAEVTRRANWSLGSAEPQFVSTAQSEFRAYPGYVRPERAPRPPPGGALATEEEEAEATAALAEQHAQLVAQRARARAVAHGDDGSGEVAAGAHTGDLSESAADAMVQPAPVADRWTTQSRAAFQGREGDAVMDGEQRRQRAAALRRSNVALGSDAGSFSSTLRGDFAGGKGRPAESATPPRGGFSLGDTETQWETEARRSFKNGSTVGSPEGPGGGASAASRAAAARAAQTQASIVLGYEKADMRSTSRTAFTGGQEK